MARLSAGVGLAGRSAGGQPSVPRELPLGGDQGPRGNTWPGAKHARAGAGEEEGRGAYRTTGVGGLTSRQAMLTSIKQGDFYSGRGKPKMEGV
jgi:hypothetical protein